MPMTWNYRIIKHDEPEYAGKEWFGLHEVYTDDGKMSWTENAVSFVCDMDEGPEGITRSLEMALADARTRPVLLMSDLLAQAEGVISDPTTGMTAAKLEAFWLRKAALDKLVGEAQAMGPYE